MEEQKIKFIIDWDRDPREGGKQSIYTQPTMQLPYGDFNVFLGKILSHLYVNDRNQIVGVLRPPIKEDLDEKNWNRKPLYETIKEKPINKIENPFANMTPAEMLAAKQAIQDAIKQSKEKG